jgi:hypothetical protein
VILRHDTQEFFMYRKIAILTVMFLAVAMQASATQYHPDWAVNNCLAHWGAPDGSAPYDPGYRVYDNDCSNFASQNFIAGVGGPLFSFSKRYTEAEFRRLQKEASCHEPEIFVDEHGCIPWAPYLQYVLLRKARCHSYKWSPSQRPAHAWQLPADIRPGDYAFYYNKETGAPKHDRLNGRVTYGAHNADRVDGDLLGWQSDRTLEIIHADDILNGCRHIYADYPIDSNFSQTCSSRHAMHC